MGEEKIFFLDVQGLYNTWVYFTDIIINDCNLTLYNGTRLILNTIIDGYKIVEDNRLTNYKGYRLIRED